MRRLQPVRGTADLLPDAMRAHRHVVETARRVAASYGHEEMATPILEFSEVFERPLGEESDVVSKETYNFADRGGEMLTLRPENTAGVVRAMISNGLTQSLPLNYFYAGPMFRYERPQKGRLRQFHQIGIESLGAGSWVSDAEIILCGIRLMEELGIDHKCKVLVNSLGDAQSRGAYREALVKYLGQRESALSQDSRRRLEANPLRILDSKDEGDRRIVAQAPMLTEFLTPSADEHFRNVLGRIGDTAMPVEHDPHLVRGLDYYCHTAFEIVTEQIGAQGTVLGGGRYDGLSETLGGPPVPGAGWAAGIERLSLLAGAVEDTACRIVVLPMDETHWVNASVAGTLMREEISKDQNLSVSVWVEGSFQKRLRKAGNAGFRYVAIIGSEEAARESVQLRDMVTGEQRNLPLTDFGGFLAGHARGTAGREGGEAR